MVRLSPGFVIRNAQGQPIQSVPDWEELAPPLNGIWKDGHSAKELAKAWFPGEQLEVPRELVELLASSGSLRGAWLDEGHAEVQTQFDDNPRGPRSHDLLLRGRTERGTFVLGMEAKASERFDETLECHIRTREKATANSGIRRRIDLLCKALFGAGYTDEYLGHLRYQLLAATAGTLVETEGRDVAVLVVMQFESDACSDEDLKRNSSDWLHFLEALPGKPTAAGSSGVLAGPVTIPGGDFIPEDMPLYLGKVVTDVRSE